MKYLPLAARPRIHTKKIKKKKKKKSRFCCIELNYSTANTPFERVARTQVPIKPKTRNPGSVHALKFRTSRPNESFSAQSILARDTRHLIRGRCDWPHPPHYNVTRGCCRPSLIIDPPARQPPDSRGIGLLIRSIATV